MRVDDDSVVLDERHLARMVCTRASVALALDIISRKSGRWALLNEDKDKYDRNECNEKVGCINKQTNIHLLYRRHRTHD